MRGWRFHRVAVFIPYMLPVTVVGVLFGELLTLHGALNTTLQTLHLNFLVQDWLGNPDWALRSLAGVIIWRELGFGVILFLARLLSLPQNVFDAARVDGAGWFRTHWHVTPADDALDHRLLPRDRGDHAACPGCSATCS